ncbi:hypothetical protein [Undibacterium luofuense]|uniref:hypothetical protein n=1 Tax=Undibacterium luofuense TaxID=2828733 RepID=UPI0030EF44BE
MRKKTVQKGNPHGITIHQHTFPKRSIERFTNSSGYVDVWRISEKLNFPQNPKDKMFCAEHGWDHGTESLHMKTIEDKFQNLADLILNGTDLSPGDFPIITEFYALWRLRWQTKTHPFEDIHIPHLPDSDLLSKDQQEAAEKNGYIFFDGKNLRSRFSAGTSIRVLTSRLIANPPTWSVIWSRGLEFIVPDTFGETGIVPLSPHCCLVANTHSSGTISDENVREINQLAMQQAQYYVFAHDLNACGNDLGIKK